MSAVAPAFIERPSLGLSDQLKIQAERIREKDYVPVGRLTAIHWEAQRNISGFSQSRPRYGHPDQPKAFADAVVKKLMTPQQADAMKPFSEKQMILWSSTTLDWLSPRKGPAIARSRDRKDWLLPEGLTDLPDIPDPRFVSTHSSAACPAPRRVKVGAGYLMGCSGCIAPRIPQLLTGCPVCGNRVQHKITAHNGYVMGILHPIKELSIVAYGVDGSAHWLKVRAGLDQINGRYPAMLIDDEHRGFFVGGTFS